MTKVKIDPGICGFITNITAESEDDMDITITVMSGCPSITKMFRDLGNTFNSYELCLAKPGANDFYKYATENFPGHAACPTISGILKAIEVECNLSLPKNASIEISKL